MNTLEYQTFYEKVGKINGWNFNNLKCHSDKTPWDFFHEVTKLCRKSDLLLDIGTGGGEAILSIAESTLLTLGIDYSKAMIETANKNLVTSGLRNVRFIQMDAELLTFPAQFFQLITCRHSVFNAKQIARVLDKGGTFLTQQVSEADKQNLKEAFGRGQALGVENGTLMKKYIEELSEAGFTDIQSVEYNVAVYYETAEDLLFLLKHTPIIPDFGESEEDFHILAEFIRKNQTEKGIRTNARRFMIIAKSYE